MRVDVRLDEAALQHLLDALEGRADRAKALRPVFHDIADDFYAVERRRFDAGMAHWKPLTPAYAVRKAAGGRTVVPLAGGALEASLTRKGARWAVRRVTNAGMFVGTKNPVAHLHAKGTKGGLPRREPVDITSRDRNRWRGMLLRHVSGRPVVGVGL